MDSDLREKFQLALRWVGGAILVLVSVAILITYIPQVYPALFNTRWRELGLSLLSVLFGIAAGAVGTGFILKQDRLFRLSGVFHLILSAGLSIDVLISVLHEIFILDALNSYTVTAKFGEVMMERYPIGLLLEAILYGGLLSIWFCIIGVGLVRGKKWAPWLFLIVTVSASVLLVLLSIWTLYNLRGLEL